MSPSSRRVKRGFDLAVAIPALLLSLPLQVVVALAVAVKLGRPVFFKQLRPGHQGQPFVLIKFRTMLPVDEQRGLIDDASRMTALGRVLRSSSIDELPTLWNVVAGQMSVVGPRPLLIEYLPLYSPSQARRHEVLPGLTGLAQVRGRNSLAWHKKLELDVEYVDHQSFLLDLLIMRDTVAAVVRAKGISADGVETMPVFRGNGIAE